MLSLRIAAPQDVTIMYMVIFCRYHCDMLRCQSTATNIIVLLKYYATSYR